MADSSDALLPSYETCRGGTPTPSSNNNTPTNTAGAGAGNGSKHNLNGPKIEIIENRASADDMDSTGQPDYDDEDDERGLRVSTGFNPSVSSAIGGYPAQNYNCLSVDFQDGDTDYPSRPPSLDPACPAMVRLQVGGKLFITQRSTLERIPGTRLSVLSELDMNYDKESREWFFDRNPELFNCILDFYRCDELHFPHNFCGPSIRKELLYWKIHEGDIAPCCWNRYREYEEEKAVYDNLDKAFESKTMAHLNQMSMDNANPTGWIVWKNRFYVFLEEPMSSKIAQTWTLCFLILVLTSIAILCIETHPSLRVPRRDLETHSTGNPYVEEQLFTHVNGTQTIILRNVTETTTPDVLSSIDPMYRDNGKLQVLFSTEPHPWLEYIDSFCTCFFTIEFMARLIVAPDRINFCKSIMNIIDVLCVMPMWIKYILQIYEVRIGMDLLPVFFLIMILRVLRICRVLRLARHYTGVKILVLALRASLRELLMLLIFVFIVMLIFAVLIYYAEFFVPDTFPHIPQGFWWVIITLTTVGYGDMYPKSFMGYCVGSMCALTGILATGLPVPIIANNFNKYYSHAQLKENIMNRKNIQDKPDPELEKKVLRLPSFRKKNRKNSRKSTTSNV